jgi:hypothetical protein
MTHTHEGPAAGTLSPEAAQAHGATPDFWPESPAPYYLVAMGELVHARNRGEDWRALVEPLRHRCPEGELALFEERVRMMEEADRGS